MIFNLGRAELRLQVGKYPVLFLEDRENELYVAAKTPRPRDSAHVQIIDGKIWIQRALSLDMRDTGMASKMVSQKNSSKRVFRASDIVLGFHPPEVRHHTGYAIA